MKQAENRPDPREAALKLLIQSEKSSVPLDRLMEEVLRQFSDKRDRHLLHALVYGVLRNRLRLDTVLTHLLRRDPKHLEPEVLCLLRIGVFQILEMNRIPHRAIVHSAVELARKRRLAWAAGLVNAVLRRAIREAGTIPLPSMESDPVRSLSIRHSFPEWLIETWMKRLGTESTRNLCEAFNRIPPLVLRTNTLKTTRPELLNVLAAAADHAEETGASPDGIRLNHPHAPVFELPGFSEGLFQVQDEAAQLIGLLIEARAGMSVLDACAGRGGKTGHIVQMMQNRGRILAVDVSAEKLAALDQEMKRLGASIVETRICDWQSGSLPETVGHFDRILLDAPCSGLGVLGRHPDIRWRADRRELKTFTERQIVLIENTISLLKPDGRLVYAVCSMEPEETDGVIDVVLQRHPAIRKVESIPNRSKGPLAPFWRNGALRTSPHMDGMDGFFACILSKDTNHG